MKPTDTIKKELEPIAKRKKHDPRRRGKGIVQIVIEALTGKRVS